MTKPIWGPVQQEMSDLLQRHPDDVPGVVELLAQLQVALCRVPPLLHSNPLADFNKIVDCTVLRYTGTADFLGVWLRPRPSANPISFADAALAGTDGYALATALNGKFVPAAKRAATALTAGDRIEILAPMQGG